MNSSINKTFVFTFLFFSIFFVGRNVSAQSTPTLSPKKQEIKKDKDDFTWVPISFAKNNVDAKVTITKLLFKVKNGEITPKQFFREVAKLPMPDGKEPRHLLMEIKKEIAQYRGVEGLEQIFGKQYSEGGSFVEKQLLQYRKDLVMEGINRTIEAFKGKNVIDGHSYSVYYAEVGSWANESFDQMKLAGDIDFNFISANRDLAMRMKQFFDNFIKNKIGMTPEGLDAPCTVHGMATPEVFVGPHGQAFAEGAIKEVKRIDQGGDINKIAFTPFDEALKNMVIEAKFASNPLPDIKKGKWPKEPGITLEMIRHFEHDVMGKNVFTDLESFMKAAKYMERSDNAIRKSGGTVSDPALAKFCQELTANKKSSNRTQADIVRAYFDSIGKPIPLEIKLGPSRKGSTPLEIEFKEKVIQDFWKSCQKAMWDNAVTGFKSSLDQMKARSGSGDSPEVAKKLDQMREMIEIEMRVLNDSNVGIKDIPPQFKRLVGEFRSVAKNYMKGSNYRNFIPIEDRKTFQFIEENLRRGSPTNIQLALGALVEAPDKINNYLDILDDTLMGEIRGEKGDWKAFLTEARELKWAKKVDSFLGRSTLSTRQRSFLSAVEKRSNLIGANLTRIISESAAARGVHSVNQIFTRSVEASRVGKTSMKALVAINLATEIPVYIDLVAKEDWSGLAAEFIIRRVPFGSAANNLYMGRYMLAVWDVGVTLVPPAAMADLAVKIGEWTGKQALNIYWAEELDEFTDSLYEGAKFQLVDVEELDGKIKLSKWRLKSVTYNGEEFDDIPGFIKQKQKEIEEMHEQCALPLRKREFPMRYTLDGITDWMKFSWVLRENVVSQDPFLVFIDELKKNPIVGPKLKDHYLDLWYTRYEEVKLAYIIHMIQMLEERRSAEQSYLSGQLPLIAKQLENVGASLQIYPQIEQNLEKEMGGTLYALYAWSRDWAKGIKRSLSDEADIWEHDKECTRILQRYLKIYQRIDQIRDRLETQISTEKKGDFGIRILTGPLMLMGDPIKDISKANHWEKTLTDIQNKVLIELVTIKNKHVKASGFEQDPKSYDQRVLRSVVAHDLWREVWKYVFRNAPKETWSVLDEGLTVKIYQVLKKAALGEGEDIEGIAKENHAYHKKQRDKIVASFEAYYMQKEEEEKAKKKKKDKKPAFVDKSKESNKDKQDDKKKKEDNPQFVKKSKEVKKPEEDDNPAFVKKSTETKEKDVREFDPTKDPFEIKSVAWETMDVTVKNKSYEILKSIDVAVIVRSRGKDHIIDGKMAFDLLLQKGYFYYKENIGYVVSEKFVNFVDHKKNKPADAKKTVKKESKKEPTTLKKGFTKDNEYYLESYRAALDGYRSCQEEYGKNCAFRFEDIRDSFPLITDPDPDPSYSPFGTCSYDREFVEGYQRYKELKKEGYDVSHLYCENYNKCYYATPEGYPGKNPVEIKLQYKQVKRPPAGRCKDPNQGLY